MLEAAMYKLDNQECPVDGATLTLDTGDMEFPARGVYVCSGIPQHAWPVRNIITEDDTNYFEAELDESEIAERLDEYAMSPEPSRISSTPPSGPQPESP